MRKGANARRRRKGSGAVDRIERIFTGLKNYWKIILSILQFLSNCFFPHGKGGDDDAGVASAWLGDHAKMDNRLSEINMLVKPEMQGRKALYARISCQSCLLLFVRTGNLFIVNPVSRYNTPHPTRRTECLWAGIQ
jgi:hypothetical protein